MIQFQSQSSLINNLFGLDSLNQEHENKEPKETEKISVKNVQTSKSVNPLFNAKPDCLKQPEKISVYLTKDDDTNICRTNNITMKNENIVNMNNALREVESLFNRKIPNNVSLPKNIGKNSINEIENLINSSRIQNVGNNFHNLLSNNENKSNYFGSSQVDISSQSVEEEVSRKRKVERREEEEKKCPKLDNKLLEMNFFDNSCRNDKISGEEINTIKLKTNNEYKQNKNSLSEIKTVKKNIAIKTNQNVNQAPINSIYPSAEQNYSNNVPSHSTKPSHVNINNNHVPISNSNVPSSNGNNGSNMKENTNLTRQIKPQSKRNSHPHPTTGNKNGRSGNNKTAKMPIIQEENEQKEQEIDYKQKLEEYRGKYNSLQTEVINIKNNLKVFGRIYEVFNNYVNQSENFKLNFRNNFKKFLNDYQEIVSNYSLLFIQLNVCHKIERKTEEFQNVFNQLKEKISLN